MTVRLPTPPAEYSEQHMNTLQKSLEKALQTLEDQANAVDPRRALTRFRISEETDTTITFTWTRGSLVADIWVHHFLVPAPVTGDPWSAIDLLVPTLKLGTADTLTLDKPPAGQQRWVQFVPRLSDLTVGPVIRRHIDPAAGHVTGHIAASVTNAVADLTVTITGAKADFPVSYAVFEDAPTGTPLVSGTLSGNGAVTKAQKPALGGRSLPLREVRRWWLRMTNRAGVETWAGPTAADRDALPGAVVTDTGNQLRIDYDDDCDAVRIDIPGGRTWTRSGLSGGGSLTYTVGNALDDSTTEAALGLDEIRDHYLVQALGGDQWVTIWDGALYGPNAPYLTATLVPAVTGDTASVTAKVFATAAAFPATATIYEGDVTTSIATGTIAANAGTLVATGRVLPLRELQKWWVKVIDALGVTRWFGPAAADRDALPNVSVESVQQTATVGAQLVMVYDDDCDQIVVSLPNGATVVYATPAGSNGVPKVYTLGDPVTTGSTEAPLASDEVRPGYAVAGVGGGVTLPAWKGSMYGKNRAFEPPEITVSVSAGASSYVFTITIISWGSSTSGQIDIVYDGTTNIAWPFSGFTIPRDSSDHTIQIIARNGDKQLDVRSFTVPALPPTGGGGGGGIVVYDAIVAGVTSYIADEITVSFSVLGTASGQQLFWRHVGTGGWSVGPTAGGGASSIVFNANTYDGVDLVATGATGSVSYEFQVRAFNGSGQLSGVSDTTGAVTSGTA